MLLNEKIEIIIYGNKRKYYESIGYNVPTYIDKKGRIKVKNGTKMVVNVLDLPKGSSLKIKYICDKCGQIFKTSYCKYNNNLHDDKYYCRHCATLIFNSGENSYYWNPNRIQEERINGRNYLEYKNFIKRVLARDNYTCQICKDSSNSKLEVHHLNGYSWDIENRTNESNGITLCKNCHNKFHTIYGRNNNTKEQFLEFIDKKELIINNYKGEIPSSKWAYCIEDNEIIRNIGIYAKLGKYNASCIYNCCNKKQKSYRSKHYVWYEDYIAMNEAEIFNLLNNTKKNNNKIKSIKTESSKESKYFKIKQYNLDGNLLKVWDNIKEIKQNFDNIDTSAIYKVCKGKLHHSMGFVWRYIDDDFDKFPIKRKDAKTVYQYDLNMNLVKIWDSTMDIQRTLGYRNHYISNCCLGKLSDVYGYIWKYTE